MSQMSNNLPKLFKRISAKRIELKRKQRIRRASRSWLESEAAFETWSIIRGKNLSSLSLLFFGIDRYIDETNKEYEKSEAAGTFQIDCSSINQPEKKVLKGVLRFQKYPHEQTNCFIACTM
jgi:hypothetical protein